MTELRLAWLTVARETTRCQACANHAYGQNSEFARHDGGPMANSPAFVLELVETSRSRLIPPGFLEGFINVRSSSVHSAIVVNA